jgi:hypothetical protein
LVFLISMVTDWSDDRFELTVTDTMADLITVVAFNDWTVDLVRFFWALGSHMAKLLAVAALDNTTINRLASIQQTLGVLLRGGPTILLLGAGSLIGPAPSDGVFLVQVSLKVHWAFISMC